MKKLNLLRLSFVLTINLLVLQTGASDSVEPGSSIIKGMILSKKTNKPVEGFEVLALKVVKKPNTNEVELKIFIIEGKFPRAKTDANGNFQIKSLPKGLYTITSATRGVEYLIKDNDKNPRVFEINSDKQVLNIGKIFLEAVPGLIYQMLLLKNPLTFFRGGVRYS